MKQKKSLYVFFGLPGAGKTFVGKLFAQTYDFFYFDADDEIPQAMKRALVNQGKITFELRDEFFERVNKKIKTLLEEHARIIVTQTFINEKYRVQLLKKFPYAQFVLVQTPTTLREKRLQERKDGYRLSKEYAQEMVRHFEKPAIAHLVITNTTEDAVKKQLDTLFSK